MSGFQALILFLMPELVTSTKIRKLFTKSNKIRKVMTESVQEFFEIRETEGLKRREWGDFLDGANFVCGMKNPSRKIWIWILAQIQKKMHSWSWLNRLYFHFFFVCQRDVTFSKVDEIENFDELVCFSVQKVSKMACNTIFQC